MQELLDDIGHPTWLPFTVIAGRLFIAALFGAIVGFEREWQNRPAGLRTHILVSLAAAAFAILGIEIVHSAQFVQDGSRLDPLRLIEAVTAGVAFLAAGSIIFAKGEVRGLTTGAGLWLAGAIGLSSGLGFWQIAAFITFVAIVVLGLMHRFEGTIGPSDEKTETKEKSETTKRKS
ncbi:MgtC/SapB family protein [Mesorhizobium sp. SB112]|uniref:MgtC/SapB family protein n=1 Tax=Mesorhizobium sp. SB112 TaxID=3151853 RepID=UPI00326435BB